MSTPRARARLLRGGLVGGCSALLTVGAHTAVDDRVPHGAALMVVLLLCATAGAVAGTVAAPRGHGALLGVIAALGGAQLLGHWALALFGGHHHGLAGLGMSPSMAVAHAAAALVLGAAIAAVEYLYVVCESVLCWLRLFTLGAVRATSRARHWATNNVVAQPDLLRSGLGMRAPPVGVASSF
ncbi:hypothetical protein H7I53_09235 [Mycolicibacterium pulveris]|uniref:hypothetical protein n=1 Tax=Mycolicibacterium pulveris TaxID=36813 RepID=UPI0013D21F9C|nr:hypothetical protein [Mycolicibacterium pulveris]MCV6980406.1 hypothetical protein [Mycolicibacterium pulveris]